MEAVQSSQTEIAELPSSSSAAASEKQEISMDFSSSSSEQIPCTAPERKVSTEDPVAIIESLRARLLAERSSSKAAKQQAQQLVRKVKELERCLQEEIQRRKKCEDVIQDLHLKLEEAGVKVSQDSPETSELGRFSSRKIKPNWMIVSRRHSSDGSAEGDANSAEGSRSPQSPSGSDTSSLIARKVGRSCRTVRRKEAEWEMGIDDQVKGSWSKVGADIIEVSKLRDASEAFGSESGWLSRAVEMLESKNTEGSWNGDQEAEKNGEETSCEISNSSVETSASENSQEQTSGISQVNKEELNADAAESSSCEGEALITATGNASPAVTPIEAEETLAAASVAQESAASADLSSFEMNSIPNHEQSSSASNADSTYQTPASNSNNNNNVEGFGGGGGKAEQEITTAAADPPRQSLDANNSYRRRSHELSNGYGAIHQTPARSNVEDVLTALRLAKQQLRRDPGVATAAAAAAGFRNSQAARYEVVTRPLAQFVPQEAQNQQSSQFYARYLAKNRL